ncbi:sugar phosphate isomerase/epimerase [Flavobacteriaceae bacterium F89]|uniref:Sugar phosphate isomerase/epimerase n=1 Tax=Cerina litoralis TaxID=2874477 RepID=A0AAE3EVN4_9FLAO|nr:sugar phosphate isomerase/epimerase family protein [Cerina litoralis]MCG2461930.1 sugar phosphate isomerase/epimerase [Cerina litoralis]
MFTRRSFLEKTALGTLALTSTPILSQLAKSVLPKSNKSELKISLAQWSLHRALVKGKIKAVDFAQIALNSYGIGAIEYVNQFYVDTATSSKFWSEMRNRAENEGVKSQLIMVDNEGNLGSTNAADRKIAVENHYKWIHAAKILGCHSIRVNAFGKGTKEELHGALVDGLGSLAEYGGKENINVLVENHGFHTSDGKFMVGILNEVNNPYLGTLPDFGNWCLNAEWGSTQNNKCTDSYDPCEGVTEFLPFAKGVSAKSYAFDSKGNETVIDYKKMLKIVKDSGFDGYIGIEFEGENMDEPDGIRTTKALIERVWSELG